MIKHNLNTPEPTYKSYRFVNRKEEESLLDIIQGSHLALLYVDAYAAHSTWTTVKCVSLQTGKELGSCVLPVSNSVRRFDADSVDQGDMTNGIYYRSFLERPRGEDDDTVA
jgi:hypothetical protein